MVIRSAILIHWSPYAALNNLIESLTAQTASPMEIHRLAWTWLQLVQTLHLTEAGHFTDTELTPPGSIKLCHEPHAFRRSCSGLQIGETTNDGLQVCPNYKLSTQRSAAISLSYHCKHNVWMGTRLLRSVHNDVNHLHLYIDWKITKRKDSELILVIVNGWTNV